MRVFVYSRHISDGHAGEAARLADQLRARNIQVVSDVTHSDLVLSLGGDGTFLSCLPIVRNSGVPVAGVNFGRLGFLTSVSLSDDFSWIDAIVDGSFNVEERLLLKVQMEGFDGYPYAMNEFSVQRRGAGVLGVDVILNGRPFPTYWADGIVVATPTGSTAYSMSVGGPILTPDAQVFVIAPIASHNLNVRPLVVPADSDVEIRFSSRDGSATVSLDNRIYEVRERENIRICRGEFGFRRVSLGGDNFISALKTKLFWGEDIRNIK